MKDRSEQTEHEDEERWISTVEELAAYFDETRQLATALVHELADEVVTDGSNPIEEILEKGYEDSFYMPDLVGDWMGVYEELETIVSTPMVEIASDWDQPFHDYDFGTSVCGPLEDAGVDEELASEFGVCLMEECLRLVESKSRTKPDYDFVDIFGLKVFEFYKPLLQAALQGALEQRQEDEDEWNDGTAGEMHRDALRSAIDKAVPLIAEWMAETIRAEGASLVINTLKRMSSQQAGDSYNA